MKIRLSIAQKIWLALNIFAFGLAIFSLGSDVWEAYVSLFLVSAIAQGFTIWRAQNKGR